MDFQTISAVLTNFRQWMHRQKLDPDITDFVLQQRHHSLRRRSETVLTKIITNCSKVLTNHAQNIFGWRAEYVNSAEKGVTEAAMPIHRTPNTFILSYLICIPWVCHQISNSPYLNIHFNWLICRQSMHPGNHIGNVMWPVVQWRHTGFMWSNKLCILLDGAKSEKSNWTSMWNWYDCHLFTYTSVYVQIKFGTIYSVRDLWKLAFVNSYVYYASETHVIY